MIWLCGIILIWLSADRPQTTGFQLNGGFSSCVPLEIDKLYHRSGHQYKGLAVFFSYTGSGHFSLWFRFASQLKPTRVESSGTLEESYKHSVQHPRLYLHIWSICANDTYLSAFIQFINTKSWIVKERRRVWFCTKERNQSNSFLIQFAHRLSID